MPDLAAIRSRLEALDQGHLLKFYDELQSDRQSALLDQIGAIDLDAVPSLVSRYVRSDAPFELPENLEPAPYYPRDPHSPIRVWDAASAQAAGEALISAGRVAAFVVAGGQGTRLGYDGPKGCYPTGCVSEKPLFELFADQILASSRTYGSVIPWYVMTSPLNHDATVAAFEENDYYGLSKSNVMFFQQGTMPAFDLKTGRILLAEKDAIATSPDGHGGALLALAKSGAIADMTARGVEHISYFQVDNPHVRVIDPVFLGLHASGEDSSGEMSSKMLPKADAKEKVGVFTRANGKTTVIEYSDMPDRLAEARDADGNLKYLAGSIAIHAISVAFVQKVVGDPSMQLPYHRAVKKVPHIDLDSGEPVQPAEPNGVKLERFVFDAIPMAGASIVYETDRVEEFAPVKNAEGVDSIVTSRQLQTERAARWLEAAGVEIPRKRDGSPECVIEISPLTALSSQQLRKRAEADPSLLPRKIERGARVAL